MTDVPGLIERLNSPKRRGLADAKVIREAAAALSRLQAERDNWQEEREKLIAERDEAVNWSDIVDRYGTDQFDDLAEAWLGLEAIQRVTNAATSTFAKWANDDLMSSFRQQQLSMFHMAFVEGCLVGAKAAEARAALALLAPSQGARQ